MGGHGRCDRSLTLWGEGTSLLCAQVGCPPPLAVGWVCDLRSGCWSGAPALHRSDHTGGPMKISVIGCGYLGAVHAASMAELGHEVVGVDVDERRVGALRAGRAPF
ncbi:hypothetical protein ABQ292_19365, partial [Geodermatophilus sp. WL48A]